jgi:putative acyl-CoA dehydrogenase
VTVDPQRQMPERGAPAGSVPTAREPAGSAPTIPNHSGNGRGGTTPEGNARPSEPPLQPGDHRTHRVENQPPPIAGADLLACDPALTDAVAREGAEAARPALQQLAALVASAEAREHARLADTHPPVLRTHDRYGHRIDEVEFHPSWHWLMRTSVGWGLHGAPWVAEPGTGAHVARAAGFYLMSQLEAGHGCPISMTYAAVPALRRDPELAARYEPGLRATTYEFGLAEPSTKAGLLAGMSMTEKQGGSDVRAGTTTATATSDGTYRLVGHKWFTSAPMNDIFLTLAHAPAGLTCFVLPRVLPDGTRNAIRLQRLKDKLGNRSNASAEIEYTGATGWRLGDEGRGVQTIIEMVSMTRLDCVLGSAAVIRAALTEAAHHVAHRSAFGARLADAPLMQSVIADLALESEAATVLAMRLAGAVDREERHLLRLALPAAKYLVCKRTPAVVAEALECLGGNGYVEESGLPRLYREAPLNSIWEGSGSVTALDVLRAVSREPESVDAVFAEIESASGRDTWFDRGVRELRTELRGREERRARRLAEMLALCLQGSLLLRHAPDDVARAFVASRFLPDGPWRTSGTLPAEAHSAALLARVTP